MQAHRSLANALLHFSKPSTTCDASAFAGSMTSTDVLKEQMDDLMRDSTQKAYQLASPANRLRTADQHDAQKFDAMVRNSYAPLLHATDYAYMSRSKGDCEETFDVLLYGEDKQRPEHGYEFALSRQTEGDDHVSLGEHALARDSQFWRTDRVLPIPTASLATKHAQLMQQRQTALRRRCFGGSHEHRSVQHSFGEDETHNLCCRLGDAAKDYADRTGNPIGRAARRISSDNWSTCMGSNVCTFYAQMHQDGTAPLFAASPDLSKLSTRIPAKMDCEAYAAEKLSMGAHGTPGITTRGNSELCSAADRRMIDAHTLESHRSIQEWLSQPSNA